MGIFISNGFVVKSGKDHYQYGKHSPLYVNILGQRFGQLLVVKQDAGKGVECVCDCGRTHVEKFTVDLRRGTRKSCGICNNRANPRFKQAEDAIIRQHAGRKSPAEIAKLVTELGFRKATNFTIKNRAQRKGISLRRHGELNPNAKGTDDEIELCRQLYDAGLTPTVIAEKMEFTVSHVDKIVHYRSRTERADATFRL